MNDVSREAIVDAAVSLGRSRGESGVTMRAIANELGIGATALYGLFGGKAAILHQIRLRVLSQIDDALMPSFDRADPLDRLIDVARRYVDYAVAEPWLYGLLFGTHGIEWEVLTGTEKELVLKSFRRVQQTLQEGVETGRFRADLDIRKGATLLWASNHGLGLLVLSGRLEENHPSLPARKTELLVEQVTRSNVEGMCLPREPQGASIEPA